jgi:hypothetical protein
MAIPHYCQVNHHFTSSKNGERCAYGICARPRLWDELGSLLNRGVRDRAGTWRRDGGLSRRASGSDAGQDRSLSVPAKGGHANFAEAQAVMTSLKPASHQPRPKSREFYQKLYRLYLKLHDAFGGVKPTFDLSRLMKDLLDIKRRAHVHL